MAEPTDDAAGAKPTYTPRHSFRIPDPDWDAFCEAAAYEQTNASAALRELTQAYVARVNRKRRALDTSTSEGAQK